MQMWITWNVETVQVYHPCKVEQLVVVQIKERLGMEME